MPSKRRCVVVLNGSLARPERLLPLLRRADWIIAADGGANWLDGQGLSPTLLVGDLDSAAPELVAQLEQRDVPVERHPVDKDETDAELALQRAAALGATQIIILGALGGRVDHELANIMLLAMPALEPLDVAICDGVSTLRLLRGAGEIRGQAGDTVSLIPWGGVAQGIVTEGLAYPLRGETLHHGAARGISNVLLGDRATVTLERGALLVVHTPRKWPEDMADD